MITDSGRKLLWGESLRQSPKYNIRTYGKRIIANTNRPYHLSNVNQGRQENHNFQLLSFQYLCTWPQSTKLHHDKNIESFTSILHIDFLSGEVVTTLNNLSLFIISYVYPSQQGLCLCPPLHKLLLSILNRLSTGIKVDLHKTPDLPRGI